jgi:hypothetical protein
MRLACPSILVLATLVLALFGAALPAQVTWLGGISGDWSLATNWSGVVPSSGTDVVIPAGTAHSPSTAGVTLPSCRDLTILAGATLTVAPGSPLAVNRDLTQDGTLAGGGTVRFVSSQTSWFGGGGTMNVSIECAKGAGFDLRPFQSMTINGNLMATSGGLVIGISNGPQIFVSGSASMQGGTFSTFQPATALLDVAGNLTFSGTLASGLVPTLRCGGNWTSDAMFTPTASLVELDGAGPQSIATATAFHDLTVHAGSIATAPAAGLTVNGNLTVDGSLAASSGPLDVNGDLTVGVGGSLDLGGGLDTFAKGFTVAGSLIATGTLVFDGTATGPIDTALALPNVQCAKIGTGQVRPVANLTIAGNLTQISGDLNVASSAGIQVNVGGNALFQGGTVSATQPGVLDVAGNVTFAGTAVSGLGPIIRCAGNWSSDAAFAPTSGAVELDGAAATTIAHATAGGTLAVPGFVVKNASRSFVNDLTIAATNLTIEAGGSLAVGGGRHLRIHRPAGPTAFAAAGALTIAANGELLLGPQTTLTVNAGGALTLVGTAAQPAKITGEAGGGYAMAVNGALAAKDFVVKEMGSAGMIVDFGATLAAPPNDLRNGTFDFKAGAAAGSVLLDVRRQAPGAPFDALVFLNTPAAAGVFNVRTSPAGVPVVLTNWSGAIAGPAFEDDPSGLVGWNLQAPPALASFAAIPGADLAEIVWHMLNETGTTSYHVRRGSSAGGPFPVAFTVSPGGMDYGMIDQPLAAGQAKFYLLYANLSGGESVLLGSGSATPYSSAPPPNVLKVASGAFSSIQAAINAATAPNSVVWVTPGVYPAFSVGASAPSNLHILGDGTGTVAVDTAGGPVQISNVPASSAVELSNLTIGSAQTAQDAIVISSCAGAVVLDQVDVLCDGTHTGIQVAGSTSVAIQRSAIGGAPGLLVQAGSHVALSRGSVTSLTATTSTIEMAGVTPGAVNVTPAGALVIRPGVMPGLDLPEFPRLSIPQALFVDAFPNSPYILIASPRLGFTTVNPFEMPVLIDVMGMVQLPIHFTDASGQGVIGFEISPDPVLLGFTYVVQLGALDPSTNNWRFSNVETMVAMP